MNIVSRWLFELKERKIKALLQQSVHYELQTTASQQRDPCIVGETDTLVLIDEQDCVVFKHKILDYLKYCSIAYQSIEDHSRSVYYKSHKFYHTEVPVIDVVRMFVKNNGYANMMLSDYMMRMLNDHSGQVA